MTIDIFNTLSTGDKVKNIKTNDYRMVVAISSNLPYLIAVEQMSPEDWNLEKSRFVVTKEELAAIKKYHEDIEEQMRKNK